MSRRRFLQAASAASTLAIPRTRLHAASPNGMLQHACIGVGGMGVGDLDNFSSHPKTRIVALCDVDSHALKAAAAKVPDAKTYSDWRELLAQEGDRVDSVNVTVPDHMHFPIAFKAIQAGKHVYCQKPMCHDVAEVRALTQAALKARVVTQLGTQMAAGAGDRTTVELLRSGAVGKIKHAYLCANRPGAVQQYRPTGPRPTGPAQPPPDHLDWNLWIGNAPLRPYAPEIYHPVKWRGWLDFGTGWSGDIGCHIFDAVWKGLSMAPPVSVTAKVQDSWKNSPARRADTWPQGNHITWVFPGNELTESPQWTVQWFDGEFYPPDSIRALYTAAEYPPESAMIVGTEGALLNPLGSMPVLLPEEKFRDFQEPRLASRNHYHLFIDACLGGATAECNFSQTGPMTEAILLGTVAVRVPDQTLRWDAAALKITGNDTAHGLLRRTYRSGWEV
jgi:predicted dehydrogenase